MLSADGDFPEPHVVVNGECSSSRHNRVIEQRGVADAVAFLAGICSTVENEGAAFTGVIESMREETVREFLQAELTRQRGLPTAETGDSGGLAGREKRASH